MKFTIEVDDREVKRALRRLTDEGRAGVKAVVKKSSMTILREAKKKAPVDLGTLRASLTAKGTDGWLGAEVGTNLEYAPYVEYGTGIYAAGGDGRKTPWMYKVESGKYAGWHRTRGMKPHPYLFPAFEMERPQYNENMRKALALAVRDASRGI